MGKSTDVHIVATRLYFIEVQTRMPLKFGRDTLTSVTCARAAVTVADAKGRTATGWGETPLSVQWAWPSILPYDPRHQAMKAFCSWLAESLPSHGQMHGHPIEITSDYQQHAMPVLLDRFNAEPDTTNGEPMPHLAALLCLSAFDIGLHDAYGQLHEVDVYQTYGRSFMNRDLADFLEADEDSDHSFQGRYVVDYLGRAAPRKLLAWHLVGGLDPVDPEDLTGDEPDDGHPVLLRDWIRTDGLKCLKVKLRGTDSAWDRHRLERIGQIAIDEGVDWLSADFNCTVTEPTYVNEVLDHLRDKHPRIHGMILYVEQPFPYDLDENRIDVHSVSARKPLFLDESAHDWQYIKLGRKLGWSGVALKTCKTQTGALLSLCWARAHGMPNMVQDLTNPMLAQIPHVQLAAHAGTIMGVETNAMQFYPDASAPEAAVHPGLYQRRHGSIDLSTLQGPGFGYQLDAINRTLPEPAIICEP